MIRYLDPRAVPRRPDETYDLSIDIANEPVTLGLISNSFPDASRFMKHVGDALARAAPSLVINHYAKADTSQAPADMRTGIARECDAVVSAYGH